MTQGVGLYDVAGRVLVCQKPQQMQDFMTIKTILTFDVFTNFLSSHDVSYSTCFFISLYRKYGMDVVFYFDTIFGFCGHGHWC
jgi:hypothetical protein